LEVIDRKTKKIRPSDVLYKRTINPVKNIYTASNIHDAILVSLEEFGKINMNRISVLLNKPADEILQDQNGDHTFIFKTHDGKLVTRDEYLSGNILEKIQEAETALESDTTYQYNIAQLQKVIPKPIPAVDIYSPLHAKWIPDDIIAQFLYELTSNRDISILYQKSSGLFKVSIPFENAQTEAFKTKRKNAQWLINHAVNGIEPVVKYTVEIDDKPVQFVDEQDTQLAKELYRKIKSTWDEWKYADK
jgi:N12 class adenine-specific DNA methylase